MPQDSLNYIYKKGLEQQFQQYTKDLHGLYEGHKTLFE